MKIHSRDILACFAALAIGAVPGLAAAQAQPIPNAATPKPSGNVQGAPANAAIIAFPKRSNGAASGQPRAGVSNAQPNSPVPDSAPVNRPN